MGSNTEVLSLEEILAEGASNFTSDRRQNRNQTTEESCSREKPQPVKLTKTQIKALQEAMYHSAENAHLEITLDLRGLGVPWTLHCWMHTLATAHEHGLESVIDQLLQDFLQVWPDDCSTQFVDECLPLLFNIFRYSKNEGTTLLLADIFATCYGREAIKEIRDTTLSGGPRIDPKFVNNPELSDVQFRVEGRVFYAHKIILITASPRFKAMLNSKFCEGNPPIIQINDIRYDIFQMVMHYLYKGGCENLEVDQNDVLELMAAANFFQLDGLLRFCESRCSILVDLDNIVSMYIHAKVYNAVQLLEFCQGFLLQNMVALLTYDDSVDGKTLCWLCTLSYRRALAKTKQDRNVKLAAQTAAKSKEKTSRHGTHQPHLSGHNKRPNRPDVTKVGLGGGDEPPAKLSRPIPRDSHDPNSSDHVMTELKATQFRTELELRNKIKTMQKDQDAKTQSLQNKIKSLQKEIASLSKRGKPTASGSASNNHTPTITFHKESSNSGVTEGSASAGSGAESP
nr:EOG090X02IW [Lepidurus arcticus]